MLFEKKWPVALKVLKHLKGWPKIIGTKMLCNKEFVLVGRNSRVMNIIWVKFGNVIMYRLIYSRLILKYNFNTSNV